MADVTLTYKGSTILSLGSSATKTIKTGGKFCEGDIGVSYIKPSGSGVNKSGSRITLNSSLVVNIKPQQAGSGTPSPTNIRNISGWTGCNLHVSPTTSGGTVYNISWSSAGELWKGTLNLETGELVATHGVETLATTGWVYTNGIFYLSNAIASTSLLSTTEWMCNQYVFRAAATRTTNAYNNWPDMSIGNWNGSSKRRIFVKDSRFSTAAAFMAAMTTPIQVYRPLVTNKTFALSPPQITALLGACNIWADCGDVTFTCS